MAIRSVRCPQCGASINAPAHLARVRCGGCQHVFSTAEAEQRASQTTQPEAKAATPSAPIPIALIAGVLAGLLLLVTTLAGLAWIGTRSSETPDAGEYAAATGDSDSTSTSGSGPASNSGDGQPEFPEATEQELASLMIARLPEAKRREIYKMIRDTAVSSVEKPILAPDGSPPRVAMEKMLEATYQNSLRQIQALHDVSAEQIQQIIAEGDMKVWDKRPRSNARRNGKRLYPKEQSRGWKGKIGI